MVGGAGVATAIFSIFAFNYLPDWAQGLDPGTNEIADFLFANFPILGLVAAIAGIIILVLGFSYLGWYFNEFMIDDEAIQQRRGVLFRQHLRARLDRLQAVDITQPLLARLFGFAAVKVEVAGGEGSGVELKFLRLGQAEALRNELLELAAGRKREVAGQSGAASATAIPGATQGPLVDSHHTGGDDFLHVLKDGRAAIAALPEREVYAVPLPRALQSVALAVAPTLIVFALIGIGVTIWGTAIGIDFAVVVFGGGLAAVLPVIIIVASLVWRQLTTTVNFKASISADGIGVRHGITAVRRQTIPPGRVQAVRLEQPWLWRLMGWWRVKLNVAGYQDNTEEVSTLLPVGDLQDALDAVWLVLPDFGDPDPAGTLGHAMTGRGAEGGFTPTPDRAWPADPFQRRHRGVRATERALLMRSGWLDRRLDIVPHERVQSLSLSQGPIARALRLSHVHLHSTKGPVVPVAKNLDAADAVALLEEQNVRSLRSRSRDTTEQWFAKVADAGA